MTQEQICESKDVGSEFVDLNDTYEVHELLAYFTQNKIYSSKDQVE